MKFPALNPIVYSAAIYEKSGRVDERIAYSSRIIYMLSGDISVTVGGARLGHLSPGHLLYIPAGVPYKIKGQYLRAAVITFDLEYNASLPLEEKTPDLAESFKRELCNLPKTPPFDKFIHIEDFAAERDNICKICNILLLSGEYSYDWASALLKPILIKIAELKDEKALPTSMAEALDSYIQENIGEDISNTELGAIFGYHPFYISKLLKEKRGVTIHQYVISHRLNKAKEMLRFSTTSAVEIAEKCGFTDASYFTKAFKNAFGCTPKEYRNSFKDELI